MSTTLIYEPTLSEPGCWKGGIRPEKKRTALVSCPKCGEIVSIGNHKIAADGTVKPSLVCPFNGCDFHDFIVLEGWK